MDFGGIQNIKDRFKDPFSDSDEDVSPTTSFSNVNVQANDLMDAYRKKLYDRDIADLMEESDLEIGEEVFPSVHTPKKKQGIMGILKKPVLKPEERFATQSILLEEDEEEEEERVVAVQRRRSMSPVRSRKVVVGGTGSQKRKRKSTKSQVFVKQSLLMNSPEKNGGKGSMSVSFENEEERKIQRTLDYYSPKKKTKIEEDEEDDDSKIASGLVISENIISSHKDNSSDLKTQETQQLYPYNNLSNQTEKDEQEIIMSPVMSNIMEQDDIDKPPSVNESQGEIISSIGLSQILQSVQPSRIVLDDEVMFEQVEVKPKSEKMYLAFHENSMCFYPCTLLNTLSQECRVFNGKFEMDWICKNSDIYYYDLKAGTEVHYDRRSYSIVQKERLMNNPDTLIRTDHLDNHRYELLGLDNKHIFVGVDEIYLDIDDFCKVEDHLLKYEAYASTTRTKSNVEANLQTPNSNSLSPFLFQFSDFNTELERVYTKKIVEHGGTVMTRGEDIFEDKMRIQDDSTVDISIDKERIPVLLIENTNYRVTKKLIEYMILGWPVLRYDVVDRVLGGIFNLEKPDDFEELIEDYGIIKNYDFTKFVMNYYGNRENMLLRSTCLKYKRAVNLKIKKSNGASSKFDKIVSILLDSPNTKIDLTDIKYMLFYT